MPKPFARPIARLTALAVCLLAVNLQAQPDPASPAEDEPSTRPVEPADQPEADTPNVVNEQPLLTVPAAGDHPRRRYYRGDESGTRFFFAPIDSLFRRVELKRQAERGTGGTATDPVTPDGDPPARTALQKDILQTYDAIMIKAVRLFRDRDYKHAAKEFRRAHVAIRRDVSSRLYLAVTFYAMHDYHEALAVLREANALYPAVWSLPFDLPAEYEKPKEYEKHLARLERRVNASPPNAELKMLLSIMYHFSGRSEDAIPLLKKAARRAKDDPLLASLQHAVANAVNAPPTDEQPPADEGIENRRAARDEGQTP